MLPSSGEICEFVIAEKFKIWKCACKNKRVWHAQVTWKWNFDWVHPVSSFVYYKEKCLSDIGEPAVRSYERESFKRRFDLNCSDRITTTQGRIKISGFFTCITSQLIYCISCHKCPGVVYIGETGRSLSDHFWLDVIKKKVALPILQEWTTSWRTSK